VGPLIYGLKIKGVHEVSRTENISEIVQQTSEIWAFLCFFCCQNTKSAITFLLLLLFSNFFSNFISSQRPLKSWVNSPCPYAWKFHIYWPPQNWLKFYLIAGPFKFVLIFTRVHEGFRTEKIIFKFYPRPEKLKHIIPNICSVYNTSGNTTEGNFRG